jgi:hypothetical protein
MRAMCIYCDVYILCDILRFHSEKANVVFRVAEKVGLKHRACCSCHVFRFKLQKDLKTLYREDPQKFLLAPETPATLNADLCQVTNHLVRCCFKACLVGGRGESRAYLLDWLHVIIYY